MKSRKKIWSEDQAEDEIQVALFGREVPRFLLGLGVIPGLLLNQELLVHSLSFSESSLSSREQIINLSELLLTLAFMSVVETHTHTRRHSCTQVQMCVTCTPTYALRHICMPS